MRSVRVGLAAALLLLVFGVHPARAATPHDVSIKNTSFMPATVTVNPGDKVVWTHRDGGTPHSVTSDPESSETFDSSPTCPASGCMTQGSVFEHTFNSVGSFSYHCRVHSSMHGTVVVQLATTTTMRPTTTTARPVATTRATATTARATTSSSFTETTETIALDTTTSEETTTTAGQVAIKTKGDGGGNGLAIAALVVAILGVLGAGGYAIYRLQANRL
ncbi:MAG: cupredoxin domain-containing protein [Actinobacteria bacterium]|nr:cupredoxin domain-containing protein [Actinomycetota bacterium]